MTTKQFLWNLPLECGPTRLRPSLGHFVASPQFLKGNGVVCFLRISYISVPFFSRLICLGLLNKCVFLRLVSRGNREKTYLIVLPCPEHFQFLFQPVQVVGRRCRVSLLRSTFQIPPIFQAGQSNGVAWMGLAVLLYPPGENPHISEQKRQHSSHQLDVMVLFSLPTRRQRGELWRGYIFRAVAGYRTISCHYQ